MSKVWKHGWLALLFNLAGQISQVAVRGHENGHVVAQMVNGD